MPTRALNERAEYIRRALDSVRRQRGVRAVPLVVVNGGRADPAVLHALRTDRAIRLLELTVASLPRALAAGRRAVDTATFAELDDDDVLLPEALGARLHVLEKDADVDAVVANGFIRAGGSEQRAIDGTAAVAADPLGALRIGNWLSPGAALFRTASIPPELFDALPQYLEWTYLATRLAQTYNLHFLDEPSFVHYVDTPLGVWNSADCTLGLPAAIQTLLMLELPTDLRRVFSRRHTDACHRAAAAQFRDGRVGAALRWHWRCINSESGWRYIPFTRKLLTGFVKA
jgi:glycosyltransferase involved in cell wall biosynthesis